MMKKDYIYHMVGIYANILTEDYLALKLKNNEIANIFFLC